MVDTSRRFHRLLIVALEGGALDTYDFKHSYQLCEGGVLLVKNTSRVVMTYGPTCWLKVYWTEEDAS